MISLSLKDISGIDTYYTIIISVSKKKTHVSNLDTSPLITEPVQNQNQYNCANCKRECNALSDWKKHLRQNQKCYDHYLNITSKKSPEKRKNYKNSTCYECTLCDSHKNMIHNNIRYLCKIRGKNYKQSAGLYRHQVSYHNTH